MNIQKKLNLNKHPGDCVPYSLVAAKNVKVSNDDRMIVNEEGLEDCKAIANSIHEDGINNFKIVGVIPTSTELILFIVNTDSNESYIYRYNEQADNCYRVNSNWKYNGGKIKGTYTYNVKNHLIIAIAESNTSIDVPLKTINIDLDSDRPDSEMSVIPQITLPTISGLNYVSGGAYKGFYFIFIRYKIDKTNYTKWYSIGFPIFNDVIIPQVINKVCFRKTNVYEPKDEPNGYCYGNTDSFSDSKDICNQTFEINISGGRSGLYQLGFIVCKKDSTQAFRTDDLNNNIFKFSRDVLVEYNVADLTTDYYNYYNVPFGQCNKGGYITSSNAVYPYDIPFFNKYNNSGKIDLQVELKDDDNPNTASTTYSFTQTDLEVETMFGACVAPKVAAVIKVTDEVKEDFNGIMPDYGYYTALASTELAKQEVDNQKDLMLRITGEELTDGIDFKLQYNQIKIDYDLSSTFSATNNKVALYLKSNNITYKSNVDSKNVYRTQLVNNILQYGITIMAVIIIQLLIMAIIIRNRIESRRGKFILFRKMGMTRGKLLGICMREAIRESLWCIVTLPLMLILEVLIYSSNIRKL